MRNLLSLVILGTLATAACGGSPTAPTSSTTTASNHTSSGATDSGSASGPTPAPAPAPPAPAPPAPAPEPPPAPPQPTLTLDATTEISGPVRWPATFVIVLWPDRVVLGDKTMPLVTSNTDANNILATDATGIFMANRVSGSLWQWAFNGNDQAQGSAVAR